MLKLSSLSPDLERLNELGYQLPLNDNEIKRLQNLNRSWSSDSARIIERFRYVWFVNIILLIYSRCSILVFSINMCNI